MNRAVVPNDLFTPPWTPGHPTGRAPYAPHIPDEVWDRHRNEIIEMYIHLNLTLDDVMRVMETYGFPATKRQYTKKLKDWGCRKYNIHLNGGATSEPIPIAQEMSFPAPDNTSPVMPTEYDGIAPVAAPPGTHDELQNLVAPATIIGPGVANDAADTGNKATTAQDIAVLRGNSNLWIGGAGGVVRNLSFDADTMDGVLVSIPEERSASSLSKSDDASVEVASIRDYSSVSSVNLAHGPRESLQRSPDPSSEVPASPVRDVAFAAQLWGSEVVSDTHAEQDILSSAQDASLDWAMAEGIADTDAPLHMGTLANNDSFTHPVLVSTLALTRAVSPTALLLMIESGRVSGELSEGDISRIEYLAESFECARSYKDAYQLHHLVFLRARHNGSAKDHVWDPTLVSSVNRRWDDASYRVQAIRSKELVRVSWGGGPPRLREVVAWCINALAEDGFWKMLLPITPELWLSAPSEEYFRNVECTLLSFYLWTQQPSQLVRQSPISDSVRSRSQCVRDFAQSLGLSVADVLSVVANHIITPNDLHQSREQATLARRALMSAQAVYDPVEGSLRRVNFREATDAVPRLKENHPSTGKYTALVRIAVREVVERNIHLELEVSALHGPRLQNRLSQASMSPSYSPTMLSTPRSSWSGFRSFKSIGRRSSKLWTSTNNSNSDVPSLLSSRRWSRASSTKSAATLQSTTTSDRDVVMEDDVLT